ncbi:hypothetical protein DSO57_1006449 [Entomophthora muscae]|uniref:Uncharacterized protein n=1 Tax=Entomophthora muscae TaxID=34485 RepID=A0ACC2UU86_9FUNG|nr:hypothetical protein DSO57_1006449 [Entomophthora muscae]
MSQANPQKFVELPEVLKRAQEKDTILIDLRRADERKAGIMPSSQWIPFEEIEEALKSSPDQVKEKYNVEEFKKEQKIIFACHAGMRAEKAYNMAVQEGYHNVQVYKGGWSEFSQLHPDKVIAAPGI